MRRATAVLVLAAMLAIGGPAVVSGAAAHEPRSRYWKARVPPSLAVYEWDNAGDLAPAEVRRRLRFLRANGFRTVYLEVGKYLDAADEANHELVRTIRGQIRRFVATAAGYGLSVQALGGGPDWFGDPRRELGPTLVRLVASYNSGVDRRERLAGVHLDLEPYTQEGWLLPQNVERNLDEYLTTIAEIVGAYRAALGTWGNRNLQLGLAIPFWFDGTNPDIPEEVEFGDDAKPVTFHVIDLMADLPGAYLVIMAYRWFTGTSNGSIALARDEFRYAAKAGARSGLIVGQRYSPVPDDQEDEGEEITTFDGLPRWRFWRAAAEIAVAFRRYPQFRGLSVDDLEAFMAAGP